MEWRERSSVSCDEAYSEAQRWIEAVTKKKFGSNNFRSALENGVLLCDLINRIKPGVVRRVNRLPTPIAGLDNLNVFLRACGKLGLKEAQLFHPGDLQDLSTRVTVKHEETCRRLKNVLITIYWLGRRAQSDRLYDGPYLNFKAFEGLLGTALYKALQDTSSQKGSSSIRDSGFADKWFSEQEELNHLRSGGGGERHRRDDSSDSLDSLGSRPHSVSSEATLKGSSEGWYSDTEADFVFRMTDSKDRSYRRSLVLTPKASAQFNQFLPTKDKQPSYVPAPLRKKRAERNEESRRSWTSSGYTEEEGTLTSLRGTKMSSDSQLSSSALPAAHLQWAYDYESGSDSDTERPDPDLVLDDLASRRFHSPSPATPVNFAVPASPLTRGGGGPWPKVTMTSSVAPQQNVSYLSNSSSSRQSEAQPPPHCSVKVDHNQVVSTDSLFREIYGTSGDEDDEVGYADPIQDDLYTRKMGVKPQSPCMTSYDKFLPKFWTPQEDVHIQKIKLGSQQRPWYKKMQGFSRKKSGSSSDDSDCDLSTWLSPAPPSSGPPHPPSHSSEATPETTVVVGKRQQETQESFNGSKSTSDIETDTSAARQQRYEELQKYREHVKESEDQWQNDLSKWKNRRRSVNSDIVKKKEEREQIEQITTSSNRRSRTFREMQEERDSNGSRLSSLSYFNEDDDAFDGPVIAPRSRTLPARSYTIDTPYSSGSSVSFLKEKEPPAASPARGRASSPLTTPSIDREVGPTGSSTNSHQSSAAAPSQTSPVLLRSRFTKTEDNTRAVSLTSSLQRLPESRRPLSVTGSQVEPTSFGSQFKQPQLNPMEPNPPAVSRVSASLPRSYQRLDSARLTSVVTPRPFGTQTNRISSLSRTNPMDNSQKTINGEVIASKKSLVPSRYHQFMTPEDEEQSNSNHSTEDEEQEEEAEKETRSPASTLIATSTQSISPVLPQVKPEAPEIPAPTKESSQESRCEMRISLNQKPNSSRDFGFQANWDSTGARVSSIQPGSPAQMCQLLPGDEVLTVNGHKVADLSYTEWKAQLEEALQEGSLVMDISRKGQNTWDRNQPSLPFRSHKTLNLTSMDHPILLGSTETKPISSSLDFTSRMSSESLQTTNILAHQVVDVASNGVNGGFRAQPVTMRNKESEPMSLKNLKRRSEFFEKGGPESTMPEIPVPSITPSSRWSWDPEEERRRQEKWQKEQERLLQEKYKRDHEKLQEEWEKAQEEIASSVNQQSSSLEVNSRTASLSSPDYPFDQPTSLLWEAEEDRKRKEEQERQRQAEERRKRDEEERELQRLRVERERRERQEEEERKRREEEEQQWQIKREEEERKRREEELRWQREREEVEERKRREEELKWQRKREEEEAERKRREEEELRWQRRREEEEAERKRKEEEERRWQIRREEEERRWQEAAEQQRRERERVLEQQQQQRAGGPHGFVHSQPQLSFIDRTKSKSSPQLDEVDTSQPRGVYVQPGGLAHWLLEEQQSSKHDSLALSERAASELELERRHILSAMRSREPERVTGGGLGERKGHQSVSQAELERQQILNEMKKKAPLLTDNSWIRQRSSTSASNKESDVPPMRRGESLDNLNPSYNSWRSSWTPRSNTHVQNYSRPHSALSGTTSSFYGGGFGPPQRPASSTLPPSYSMSSLRGGAGRPTSPWSRQSHPSSPSPTTSPEPELEAPQQRNRSVSGKKICTFCENPLGKGAAMIIESLGLCYHLSCFKCFDCKSDLGGSEAGAEVRIRNKQLYCNNCYMGFKSGQPTSM